MGLSWMLLFDASPISAHSTASHKRLL